MKKNNPFSLSFGRKPFEYISRIEQTNTILETFDSDPSPSQVYMIKGVRGSGKTVMMSKISEHFRDKGNWIVIELSPERDLLNSLASRLYNSSLHTSIVEAKIDLSFFGIGISIKAAQKITDIDVAIEKMLDVIKKKKKRLLITIDEVVNNKSVREFASMFQIYMRQEYPIYLLMTGLYENIYNLQNEKSLTFLYRAPKLSLEPLNAGAVINSYKNIFKISDEKAREMYTYTWGYPFAFQVLGYLCWEHGGADSLENVLPVYDQYLDEYVYSKIWSEMSDTDRNVIKEMSESGENSVTVIRKKLNMETEKFSVYRRRLIDKGLITGEGYGKVKIILPRFDVFVKTQLWDGEIM